MATKKKTFEEALTQLETLVKQLEKADVPLDEALKFFEEGMALSAFCRQTLDSAEETVTKIIRENSSQEVVKPLN